MDIPAQHPTALELFQRLSDQHTFSWPNEGLAGLEACFKLESVDGESEGPWKEVFIGHFCQTAGYLSKLEEIENSFLKKKLDGIVLKGLELSLTIYRQKLGSRELSDIDLLVRGVQFDSVKETLLELGYSHRMDTDMGFVCDGYHVDLHFELLGRIEEAYAFDTKLAWGTCQTLTPEYRALTHLEPSFNFCYLAAHGMKHGFSRLKWLLDLALLTPDCAAEQLRAMAVRTNSLETVSVALAANQQLFGVAPPSSFQEDIEHLGFVERIFVKKIVDRTLPEEAGKLLAVWGAKGAVKKTTLVKQLMSVEGESLPDRGKRVLNALGRILKRD